MWFYFFGALWRFVSLVSRLMNGLLSYLDQGIESTANSFSKTTNSAGEHSLGSAVPGV